MNEKTKKQELIEKYKKNQEQIKSLAFDIERSDIKIESLKDKLGLPIKNTLLKREIQRILHPKRYEIERLLEKRSNDLPDDFYNSIEWAKKRIEILTRDHYKCVHCGNPANHVDHLNSARYYPQLALDNDNLISSCEPCHKKRQPRGKWK